MELCNNCCGILYSNLNHMQNLNQMAMLYSKIHYHEQIAMLYTSTRVLFKAGYQLLNMKNAAYLHANLYNILMSCHNEKPEMNQAVNHPQGPEFS